MKITYIAHSGFCVELEKHVLLFDYFTGELPSWDKEKTILVFASHKHQDHFSLRILELRKEYPHIHYFFGNDIKLKPDYLLRKKADPEALSDVTVMKAHEQTGYGGESQAVTVRTLKSTDEGVSCGSGGEDLLPCRGFKLVALGRGARELEPEYGDWLQAGNRQHCRRTL